MKPRYRSESLRGVAGKLLPLVAVAIGLLFLAIPATQAGESTNSSATANASLLRVAQTDRPTSSKVSDGVSEILKMADAGVTTEVIKAYVECSAAVFPLTSAEIIALKEHKVADEIVTLMLKRGVDARAVADRVQKDQLALNLDSRLRAAGGFDPEGYDYFQYYYLRPRALASAYQRLAPYYYHPYSYRYRYPFRR